MLARSADSAKMHSILLAVLDGRALKPLAYEAVDQAEIAEFTACAGSPDGPSGSPTESAL